RLWSHLPDGALELLGIHLQTLPRHLAILVEKVGVLLQVDAGLEVDGTKLRRPGPVNHRRWEGDRDVVLDDLATHRVRLIRLHDDRRDHAGAKEGVVHTILPVQPDAGPQALREAG